MVLPCLMFNSEMTSGGLPRATMVLMARLLGSRGLALVRPGGALAAAGRLTKECLRATLFAAWFWSHWVGVKVFLRGTLMVLMARLRGSRGLAPMIDRSRLGRCFLGSAAARSLPGVWWRRAPDLSDAASSGRSILLAGGRFGALPCSRHLPAWRHAPCSPCVLADWAQGASSRQWLARSIAPTATAPLAGATARVAPW